MKSQPWWISQAEGIAEQEKRRIEFFFPKEDINDYIPWPYSDEDLIAEEKRQEG